jgi:hypothetical protein
MRRTAVLLVALGLSRAAGAQPAPSPAPVIDAPAPAPAEAGSAPSVAAEPAAPDTPEVPATTQTLTVPSAVTTPPAPEKPPEESAPPAAPSPAHVPPAPAETEQRKAVITRAPRARDFGLELDVGLNTRLGRNGSYSHEENYGGNYGFGAWVALADHVELGLEVTHTELGRVSNERSPNLVWAEYGVTTLWFGGRFEPWRSNDVATFVALRLGLGAQSVDARGTRAEGSLLAPAESYACSETKGPGVALGGGGGAAWLLGPRVQLIARLDASAHRLDSDWLGRCAVGIGSVTSVSVGLGLAYGFESGPAS